MLNQLPPLFSEKNIPLMFLNKSFFPAYLRGEIL